jgi:hypothetical protein
MFRAVAEAAIATWRGESLMAGLVQRLRGSVETVMDELVAPAKDQCRCLKNEEDMCSCRRSVCVGVPAATEAQLKTAARGIQL